MAAIYFLLAVLLIIWGVLLSLGKGASLVAGYNTLSTEEKAKYDEKRLCKFMGKSNFVMAFDVSLWGISDLLKQPIVFYIGLVLFFCTIAFILFYMNTKNRFKKDSYM